MYIYNVTTNIEEASHDSWVKWMKEIHIPEVLSTGKFLNAKFAYGTLQEKEVQLGVFSRLLNGTEDELPQYVIADTKVANLYPTLQHTGKEENRIKGQVYTLSHQELQMADIYEGEAYERIQIKLSSGKNAWAYIAK